MDSAKKEIAKKLEFQNVQNSKKQPMHIPNGLKSESRMRLFFSGQNEKSVARLPQILHRDVKNLRHPCRRFFVKYQ
jgi:hypothetical protein